MLFSEGIYPPAQVKPEAGVWVSHWQTPPSSGLKRAVRLKGRL